MIEVENLKTKTCLNKAVFAGLAILDLSKLSMAKFHFDTMKNIYPNDRSHLLYTDTDSLLYTVITENIYEDLKFASDNDIIKMDFSNYPSDHPFRDDTNENKVGYWKDELASLPISEYIGIRPKLYSILTNKSRKKAI